MTTEKWAEKIIALAQEGTTPKKFYNLVEELQKVLLGVEGGQAVLNLALERADCRQRLRIDVAADNAAYAPRIGGRYYLSFTLATSLVLDKNMLPVIGQAPSIPAALLEKQMRKNLDLPANARLHIYDRLIPPEVLAGLPRERMLQTVRSLHEHHDVPGYTPWPRLTLAQPGSAPPSCVSVSDGQIVAPLLVLGVLVLDNYVSAHECLFPRKKNETADPQSFEARYPLWQKLWESGMSTSRCLAEEFPGVRLMFAPRLIKGVNLWAAPLFALETALLHILKTSPQNNILDVQQEDTGSGQNVRVNASGPEPTIRAQVLIDKRLGAEYILESLCVSAKEHFGFDVLNPFSCQPGLQVSKMKARPDNALLRRSA